MTAFLSPWQWLWLSIQRKASSGGPVLLLTLVATAVLAAVLVPLLTVSASVDAQRSGSGVLTQIDVSPGDEGAAPALTLATRDAIAAMPGVRAVTADLTVGVYAGGDGTWSTTVRTANPAAAPPGIDPGLVAGLGENEVVVPAAIDGTDLRALVGSTLAIEYTRASGENEGELRDMLLEPVAAYDPEWQGYGPGAIIGGETLVATLLAAREGVDVDTYLAKSGIDAVIVTVADDDAVSSVTARLRELGFVARPQRDTLGELPGIVALFPALFTTVGIAVVLLLTLLVTTVVRTATMRRAAEFGLLRIRGWRIRDVRTLIVLDLGLASAAGSAAGVATGTLAATLIGGAPTVNATLATALGGLMLGPVLLAVGVGLVASGRTLRRDPYLSLVRPG